LYNLPNLAREDLELLLLKRSEDFISVPRTEDSIYEFKRKNKGPQRLSRPFPEFHHCPFLGLIGREKSRVGCLLHPDAPGNNGADYRSLSWYGIQACRTYFCPATHKLPTIYQSILLQAIDDWYIYGLIVTEHALVTAYFKEMEFRLKRPIMVSDYTQNTGVVAAFREFAELKIKWPYRSANFPGPCNYFFENSLYPRPAVFRKTSEIPQSRYENIFRELDSGFFSEEDIAAAERVLDDLFFKTVRAIEKSYSISSSKSG
jgi:hypothetical protein